MWFRRRKPVIPGPLPVPPPVDERFVVPALEPLFCVGDHHQRSSPTGPCACGFYRSVLGHTRDGAAILNQPMLVAGEPGHIPDEDYDPRQWAQIGVTVVDPGTGNVYDAAALVAWDKAGRPGAPPSPLRQDPQYTPEIPPGVDP